MIEQNAKVLYHQIFQQIYLYPKALLAILYLLLIIIAPPIHSNSSSLRIEHITNNIYAIIGALGQRSPTNLGNNATFRLAVTNAGAALINPGTPINVLKNLRR